LQATISLGLTYPLALQGHGVFRGDLLALISIDRDAEVRCDPADFTGHVCHHLVVPRDQHGREAGPLVEAGQQPVQESSGP